MKSQANRIDLCGVHRGEETIVTYLRLAKGWEIIVTIGKATKRFSLQQWGDKPSWALATRLFDNSQSDAQAAKARRAVKQERDVITFPKGTRRCRT